MMIGRRRPSEEQLARRVGIDRIAVVVGRIVGHEIELLVRREPKHRRIVTDGLAEGRRRVTVVADPDDAEPATLVVRGDDDERVVGAIDGETMLFFVEELLVPTLTRGEIVLMDNASIHKLDEIEDALEAAGAGLLFLPPYAPDLNPIEHVWSKVKARLRALKARTGPALLDALVTAFATITPQDLRGWFQHCGYEVVLT
jgi:transposase